MEAYAEHGATAWDFVVEVAKVGLNSLLPGAALVAWGIKRLGKPAWNSSKGTQLRDWLNQNTGHADFDRLRGMDPNRILDELPQRLLQDLAENLPERQDRRCRGVLFLDTYEELLIGDQTEDRRLQLDDWVRRLYHPKSGVLLVIAGRDRLRWGDHDADFTDARHLEQHLVGGLSRKDAEDFLWKCGLSDQSDLIEPVLQVCAEPTPNEPGDVGYHAFSLGLCADRIMLAKSTGERIAPAEFQFDPRDILELARRFLTSIPSPDLQEWIRHLAVTPRFDEQAAKAARSNEWTTQAAAWGQLQRFSFLRPLDDGWWTLHPLMRTAVVRLIEDVGVHHRRWQATWTERSADDIDEFAALAWSHRWAMEPDEALAAWNQFAERERRALRMGNHFRLLGWWPLTGLLEQPPPTSTAAKALVDWGIELGHKTRSSRAQNLQTAIACYDQALMVYTAAEFPQAWAATMNNRGNAYQDLPTGNRGANLREAIMCYDQALTVYTATEFPQDWAATMNNRGLAYQFLPTGDRGANLQAAIACCDQVLMVYTATEFPQDWAGTMNNRGLAYQSLPTGDRGANLQAAIACYDQALTVRTATEFPQDWAGTMNNRGNAYQDLPTGDREANLREAIMCYDQALTVRTATEFPQDWAATRYNVAMAQAELADVTDDPALWDPAESAANDAIRGFESCGDEFGAAKARRTLEVIQRYRPI